MPPPQAPSPPQPFTFTTLLPPESDTAAWKLISSQCLTLNRGQTRPLLSVLLYSLCFGSSAINSVAPTDSAQSVVFEIITNPFSVVKASIIQPPRTTETQPIPLPPTFPTTTSTSHIPDTTTATDTPVGVVSSATATVISTSSTASPEASSTPSVPGGGGALHTSPNECYEAFCTSTAPPQMPAGTNYLPSGVQLGDGSTSPTAPTSTPTKKLSAGVVAGIALGGLILLGVALGAWYFCVHHRRRQRDSGLGGGVLGHDKRLVPTSYPSSASRPRNRKEVPRPLAAPLPGKRELEALPSAVGLPSASTTDQEGPGRREPLQDPLLEADELDRLLPGSSGERHVDAGPVLSLGRSPSGRLPPAYGEQPPAYREQLTPSVAS
ncbi:hypothetical protein C8F01DRAFT_1346408 [Mycena amicta]|nr:hypothetical protein C8F01DRAFT_1346408 [Mycena amicta]